MEVVGTEFKIPWDALKTMPMRRRRALQLCRLALRESDLMGVEEDLGDRLAAILGRLEATGQWQHAGAKIGHVAHVWPGKVLALDENEKELVRLLREAFNRIEIDLPPKRNLAVV